MSTFSCRTMVRDRLIDLLQPHAHAVTARFSQLTGMARQQALIQTMHGMINQLPQRPPKDETGGKQAFMQMVNLQELFYGVADAIEIPREQVTDAERKTAQQKGAFKEGVYIVSLSCSLGHAWYSRCIANPGRYPAIPHESNESTTAFSIRQLVRDREVEDQEVLYTYVLLNAEERLAPLVDALRGAAMELDEAVRFGKSAEVVIDALVDCSAIMDGLKGALDIPESVFESTRQMLLETFGGYAQGVFLHELTPATPEMEEMLKGELKQLFSIVS